MIKSILFAAGLLLVGLQSTAQVSWQSVSANAAGSYYITSTQNGFVYARKGTSTLISRADGAPGTFTALTTAPSTSNAALYGGAKVLFLQDGNGTMRSLDYGATWMSANQGMIGNDSTNLRGMIALDSTHWVILHHGNSVHKIYVSDNSGANWSATLNMFSSQSAVSVLADEIGRAWLITNAKVYKSYDWGGYWDDMGATMPTTGVGPTVRFADGSFLMYNGTNFYTSVNEGMSWTSMMSAGLPASGYPRQFIKSPASDTLYMSTEVFATKKYGLFMSTDKGATWTAFDNGLPANVKLNTSLPAPQLHIAFNGHMFASPDSGDIYRTDVPVTASTVIVTTAAGVSATTNNEIMLKAYPNPASKNLTLSFVDMKAGVYSIHVTDLVGRTILKDRATVTAAKATQMLDISALTPGTYYLQMRGDNGVATRAFIKQ